MARGACRELQLPPWIPQSRSLQGAQFQYQDEESVAMKTWLFCALIALGVPLWVSPLSPSHRFVRASSRP